jgi:NADPH:quinone reductase-like Zn-dependent oxidoreductase
MDAHMRALRLHEHGGHEAIVFEDAPVPRPGIGDVLVQVTAASLTPTELTWPSTWVDHGGRDRVPVIPCHEVCGVVVELGYGTFGFRVGDEVFGLTDWYRDGAAAEYVAVEARNLAPKPSACSAADAAASSLAGLTAWQALFDHGNLVAGQTVLVLGATGGVGLFALQLASAAGATVIAAGRGDRASEVRALGADEYVDLERDGWDGVPKDLDLAFDLVGNELVDPLVQGRARRVVSVVEPRDGLDFFVVVPDRSALVELARRIDAGTLRPVVGMRVPLADGAKAFAPTPGVTGKRVIEVG